MPLSPNFAYTTGIQYSSVLSFETASNLFPLPTYGAGSFSNKSPIFNSRATPPRSAKFVEFDKG